METTTYSPKLYWKVCAALMALLALTWSIGYVNLGSFNLVVALAISICKALLVALFFMHIKGEQPAAASRRHGGNHLAVDSVEPHAGRLFYLGFPSANIKPQSATGAIPGWALN